MYVNPLLLLQSTINTLWFWTYGIIVGWGASFTIVLAVLIVFFIRLLRMTRRINALESRIVTAEREINIALRELQKKN